MQKKITEPVVVVGLGRSGSTIFHKMLSAERSLEWFCQVLEKKPNWPGANKKLMSLRASPLFGNALRARLEPVEAYAFWNRAFPGFRSPVRDLTATDVNDRITESVHAAFCDAVNSNERRLLLKITGWPRITCLKSLFADAKFVHVSRDPRAVVNSLLQVPWWRGWHGPSVWRWGPLSESDNEIWLQHDRSFVALAAIQCRVYQRAYRTAIAGLAEGEVFDIRYEELCSQPREQMAAVFNHAGLEWSAQFEKDLGGFTLRNTDYKYRQQLSSRQIAILESTLDQLEYEC